MAKEVVPVRNRLARMQRDNYKSLPERQFEQSVEQEIEELRQKDMIRAVSIHSDKLIGIKEIGDNSSAKEEGVLMHEEKELLMKIELQVGHVESVKVEMMKKGNFMKHMHDIKKAEKEILPLLLDAKAKGVIIPDVLKKRIAMATPKAAIIG